PQGGGGQGTPARLGLCPAAPKGAAGDALGCPGDEVAHGVLDGLDRCPRTPIGATVDASGCSVEQRGRRPTSAPPPTAPPPSTPPPDTSAQARAARHALDQPAGPLVLEGVTFESGSARLQ